MKTIKLFVFVFLILNSFWLKADPTPPPVLPPSTNPQQAPIDGGVIGLLVAGISYGFYKFKKQVA